MKERPILLSGEMVRAILEGRKTQTRRIVKLQLPENYIPIGSGYVDADRYWATFDDPANDDADLITVNCPYGKPGDRLWVRETWATDFERNVLYRATDKVPSPMGPYGAKKLVDGVPSIWRPSILMPRGASRLTLKITGVRVERLQEISEEDAEKEGCERMWPMGNGYYGGSNDSENPSPMHTYRGGFRYLWDRINGKRASWGSNPLVWVIEFKKAGGE